MDQYLSAIGFLSYKMKALNLDLQVLFWCPSGAWPWGYKIRSVMCEHRASYVAAKLFLPVPHPPCTHLHSWVLGFSLINLISPQLINLQVVSNLS